MAAYDPHGFPDERLEELARKLEAAFSKINTSLLKAAGLSTDDLVAALIEVQAGLLGFDEHGKATLRDAIEAARVKTYSQGNIFMACVLCSAIALSEFKRQPLPTATRWSRLLRNLRAYSTNAPTLAAFAWASFYALMGSKTWERVRRYLRNRPLTLS